jgi:hypothetical protein
MIAIIQTATNAARTTNETQVPNGRPQGAYGGFTDLFAKLDNARLCSGNGNGKKKY